MIASPDVPRPVVALGLVVIFLFLVLLSRSARSTVGRDKVEVMRRLDGRNVIVYVGTKGLRGYEGVLLSVDSDGCSLRLSNTGKERSLLLKNISLVTEVDGSVISSF